MNANVFTVELSKVTKNGNFFTKIVNKSVISVESGFGTVQQERSKTYYMFTNKLNPVGAQASLDLSKFDIVGKEYTIEETGEVVTLDYLYPKR